ncbi:uncharacterized protein LOC132901826 [Amyelois transitella]|uniref:uncharacterized protein LOC132901826 n=1 Tax=Amyelois transitella TaxID=680683 RepID=UPI00298F5EF5|nr:uncharacterized protein LOC132901826 [Amyelois transitella]
MIRQALIYFAISSLLLMPTTNSYKTWNEILKQQKKVENETFTASDTMVGKAMDFIYTNRTVMSFLARELWNMGSTAIDKIVQLKGSKKDKK